MNAQEAKDRLFHILVRAQTHEPVLTILQATPSRDEVVVGLRDNEGQEKFFQLTITEVGELLYPREQATQAQDASGGCCQQQSGCCSQDQEGGEQDAAAQEGASPEPIGEGVAEGDTQDA